MKNFCYCIGGTGTRVAEVASHLCAANLAGTEDITFIIVDKDDTNGGTRHARNVIGAVTTLANDSGDNEGALKRSTLVDPSAAKEFCKSHLSIDSWGFSKALNEICHLQQDAVVSLKQSVSVIGGTDDEQKNDAMLLDAFFSASEQRQETSRGFYGHPSIGALIFKYMIEEGGWHKENVEGDIAAPIKKYLASHTDEVRVFIIGSIFGGTGASVFSNLATYIRNSVGVASSRVKISGALLLPYFSVPAVQQNTDGIATICSDDFNEKSQVALYQYGADPNLMRTATNPEGVFDSLYVCGQDPRHTTARTNENGGDGQKNHIDFVDLVAAKSMTEFFMNEITDGNQGKIYEYRFDPGKKGVEKVTLDQLPKELAVNLKALLLFSGMVICRMYGQCQIYKPADNHMLELLYGKELSDSLLNRKHADQLWGSISGEVDLMMKNLSSYCMECLDFLYDISRNGRDWSDEGNNHSGNYVFFDHNYIQSLKDIYLYLKGGQTDDALSAITNVLQNNKYVPQKTSASIKDIEDHMSTKFSGKPAEYKNANTSAAERISDFAHEVFKYCVEVSK